MTHPNESVLEAIKVRVENFHELHAAAGPTATPAKQGYTGRYETVVLTANDPVQCVLPEDPTRVKAFILAVDNDVVIGTKNQAQAGSNTVASVPQPSGFYLPSKSTGGASDALEVIDCNAVYAGVTTTGSNSRVAVASYYQD